MAGGKEKGMGGDGCVCFWIHFVTDCPHRPSCSAIQVFYHTVQLQTNQKQAIVGMLLLVSTSTQYQKHIFTISTLQKNQQCT